MSLPARYTLRTVMKTALVALAFLGAAVVADEISPAELSKNLEKRLGEDVTFTDEILRKTKKQEIKGYLKFETVHLRCVLSKENEHALALLETLMKERAPRRATFTGTVAQHKDLQVFVEITSIDRPRYRRRGR